jgi:hypothetical protein
LFQRQICTTNALEVSVGADAGGSSCMMMRIQSAQFMRVALHDVLHPLEIPVNAYCMAGM